MPPRKNTNAPLRTRPFEVKRVFIETGTTTARETLLTPSKGTRIRLIRVRAVQAGADVKTRYELYFGTSANMVTTPEKAIDMLLIPADGEDSTSTFLRSQGPRGLRDEVLSGRFRLGTTFANLLMVWYTEEA